jgi:class 3 adenylate cyclase
MDRIFSDKTLAFIGPQIIDDVHRTQPMSFPRALEDSFKKAHFEEGLRVNRIAIMVGTVLLAIFGVLDSYIFPDSYKSIWAIRFGLLVPIAALVCVFSFTKHYRLHMQLATSILMTVVLCGVLVMAAIGQKNELGSTLYLFGVLPIVSFLFVASRLHFKNAVIVALVTLLVFELILFRPGGLWHSTTLSTPMTIAANFLLVSEIIIGGTASFFYERSTRHNFVQKLMIELERAKSDGLVYNMLPEPIAERMKRREVIADKIESASVCFADFTNFTRLSSTLTPSEVLAMLDQAFTKFDDISQAYGAEKIKTIGDSYMVAMGVPSALDNHVDAMCAMTLEMRRAFLALPIVKKYDLNIRIGFSSGPMIAGVVGSKKQVYDLWGDVVNTASRMESNGIPGEIQLSHYAYKMVTNKDRFTFEDRGEITIKGKGEMRVYLLKSMRA